MTLASLTTSAKAFSLGASGFLLSAESGFFSVSGFGGVCAGRVNAPSKVKPNNRTIHLRMAGAPFPFVKPLVTKDVRQSQALHVAGRPAHKIVAGATSDSTPAPSLSMACGIVPLPALCGIQG